MTDPEFAVWQISAGPTSRAYAEIFMRYGVALIGPGDAGPWNPARDDDEFEGGFVRRFASEMKVGRRIPVAHGARDDFGRRPRGRRISLRERFRRRERLGPSACPAGALVQACQGSTRSEIRSFGANPPRCARVWTEEVVDFAERFLKSPPTHWQSAPLPELPAEQPPLDQVPDTLLGIVAQAADLVPLLQDGQAFGEHPSEDELIAHFVVPFLRALGWPPEWIAVNGDTSTLRCSGAATYTRELLSRDRS